MLYLAYPLYVLALPFLFIAGAVCVLVGLLAYPWHRELIEAIASL